MKNRVLYGLMMAVVSACSADRYYANVSSKDVKELSQEKIAEGATRISGIDIWTAGLPNRKYKILGMIKDTRRNAGFDQVDYYQDIAKITRKVGGDAAVIVIAESKAVTKVVGDCDSGSSTLCQDSGKSGAGFNPQATNMDSTVYSENRESNDVPLEYRESHILVVDYAN